MGFISVGKINPIFFESIPYDICLYLILSSHYRGIFIGQLSAIGTVS